MYSFLVLCAFCEAFLLRFFVALVKEGRNASREFARDFCGSRQAIESEDNFPMNSQGRSGRSNGKRPTGTGKQIKTAAMVVMGALLLTCLATLPLRAQEASSYPPAAANSPSTAISPDVAKQIEALTKRVEQLEQQLREHDPAGQPDMVVQSARASVPVQALVTPVATEPASADPAKNRKIEPFSDWDWTWLNGNPRNKDVAFDSKFFTPEIRADITLQLRFQQAGRQFNRRIQRDISVQRNPARTARPRRRLSLRQCSRPVHDAIWHVLHDDGA